MERVVWQLLQRDKDTQSSLSELIKSGLSARPTRSKVSGAHWPPGRPGSYPPVRSGSCPPGLVDMAMVDTATQRVMSVYLVHMDPSKCPKQYKVTVPRNGTMKDLCGGLAVAANVDLNTRKLIVTDVYNHRFHKIYADKDSLLHILDRDDINIHEIDNKDDSSGIIIPIYQREIKNSSFALFGQPFFVDVPRECTYELLYNNLLKAMSRYVPSPKHDLGRSTFRPFNISIVNNYGKTEIDGLLTVNNGSDLLQLEDSHYLALDWYPASKMTYYNESDADEVTQDHSILCKVASKEDCSECSNNHSNAKVMKTTQNIREDLEGTTREIIQKLLTKIDDLNVDLEHVNVPEIKTLNEKFYENIENLNLLKDAELQKVMTTKEKEMQVINDKYNQIQKKIEEDCDKKKEKERKQYEDEKRELEDNSKTIKDEIMKSIDTLTDILHKLEEPSEPELDPNIKKDMECPICLTEMKPPTRIFQCSSGHLICDGCKENLGRTKCPTCKEANIMGRAIAMEQLARTLYRQHMQDQEE